MSQKWETELECRQLLFRHSFLFVWCSVIDEIRDRQKFLAEMEALGQGRLYHGIIRTEISQVSESEFPLLSITCSSSLPIGHNTFGEGGENVSESEWKCVWRVWVLMYKPWRSFWKMLLMKRKSNWNVVVSHYFVHFWNSHHLVLLFAEAPGDGGPWQAKECRTEKRDCCSPQWGQQAWSSKPRSRAVVLSHSRAWPL